MRRWPSLLIVVAATLASTATAAAAPPHERDPLDAYTTAATPKQLTILRELGYDVTARQVGGKLETDVVLSRAQRAQLTARGVRTRLTRVPGGQTVRQYAAAQAQDGFTVWRSWDEPGGIQDQMRAVAADNPRIAKLVTLGTSTQGREILALKLTRRARSRPDGSRPAVLYLSTQHAREWIATEVNRRLLMSFVNRWREGDAGVRELLRGTELWFVLVANPDGYEYTFDTDRLWRKTLRDNNGDGQITTGDGVDPNRNFPNHWGYDEEGSSSLPAGETYRGPSPASEPETQALKGLLDRIGFEFVVNWHSNGQWLLYGEGWQTSTPTADDPIYYALAGNLDRPAIPEFHPGLSSDVLYVTNGDTNDYAHAATGALGWVPELSAGCDGCGFVFPDDEALVQAEFERNMLFAESVAESAPDPARPVSSLGIQTKPFYLKSDDPYKGGLPDANFTFAHSYGDPQPVQVLARRSLGPVTLHYRINGGPERSAPTAEWEGGGRYKPAAVHYHRVQGNVTGTDPGDSVEVWFQARGPRGVIRRSESFTYEAASETGNRVLVVAAEDYTGTSPAQDPGPHHVTAHLEALAANGIAADVYDVDARGRMAPTKLGVLSHYDAVLWYSGDDVVTREADRGPGNADRLAMEEILNMRAYMNEGGSVLYSGKTAGEQYGTNLGVQFYDPKDEGPCRLPGSPAPVPNDAFDPRRCLVTFGSRFGGDFFSDVLEYWFGAYLPLLNDGIDPETGAHFDALGVDVPFAGLAWGFGAPGGAVNQDFSSSFVATSGILPPDRFPQFRSWPSSRWDKPGGPFAAHTGEQFAYSQIAHRSYKRLTREIAVPAEGEQGLSFWTSYDTEVDFDYLFVEARTAGDDDWTTLPDENGHTTQATGASCTGGWRRLHPQLDRYQTRNPDNTCTPTGTTGEWHAATGNSGGWQEWRIDLSRWAGQIVEISIAYASDPAVQGLGVLVDDVTLPDGTSTSFEEDLGGWVVSGPPPGSGANSNDWTRSTEAAFPVGASITTGNSIILGFGIEGIRSAEERAAVVGRAVGYLLSPPS
jgi:hypothetical protein